MIQRYSHKVNFDDCPYWMPQAKVESVGDADGEYIKLSDVLALLDLEILRATTIRGDYKAGSQNWIRADARVQLLDRLRAELGAE